MSLLSHSQNLIPCNLSHSSRANIASSIRSSLSLMSHNAKFRNLTNLSRASFTTSRKFFVRTVSSLPSEYSTPKKRSVVKFPGLKADDFRHPLDRQNTAVLNLLPGVADIGAFFLGPLTEQLILEAIGNSVLVGNKQLTKLHKLMEEAAAVLDMPAPDLYVRQSPIPNAMAVYGNKPFVVINTAIIELMTPEELQAVLAHELGHLKCDHGIWLNIANILTLGAYSLPGIGAFIFRNLQDQIMRWFRSAELSCDRAALLVAQDPKVVISMLMKVTGGSPSIADDLNVEAFLQQARAYETAANQSVFSRYYRTAQTRQSTHPLPVFRALEIDQWSSGQEYANLLKRGT